MLTHLMVRNFVIIELVEIDFPAGFIAITGETGAGKSVILDALEIALGALVNATQLRKGEDHLEIQAHFLLHDQHPALSWLKQHALDDNNLCVLRRTFAKGGQARGYVNGVFLRLPLLKELAVLLVSTHSQHAQQALLNQHTPREFLDCYAQHQQLLQIIAQHYQHLKKLQREYQAYVEEEKKNKEYIALLRYQIEELSTENILEDEYQRIEKDYQRIAYAEKIFSIGGEIDHILNSSEQDSVYYLINRVSGLLNDLKRFDDSISIHVETIQQVQILLQEINHDVIDLLQKLEVNHQHKQKLEQRLEMFFQLSRKNHVKAEELFFHLKKLKNDLATITKNEDKLQNIAYAINQIQSEYKSVAAQLHNSRKKYAQELSTAVTKAMQQLAMSGGHFMAKVIHQDNEIYTLHGSDYVEFLVAMNPGQTLQPIAKVASGGELSRLSLILESLLNQQSKQKTLIFDEVDTGIGGAVATMIGERLKQLALQQQILCITHLPQVAAFANCQIEIIKITGKKESKLQMRILDETNRIQELARMLGGKHINSDLINSAKKMLRLANEK